MLVARDYRIRGRVQGVGYRYFARRAAERLGVRGFVRNLPGGDVEVHAEADTGTLQEFRAELERGPVSSRVSEIVETTTTLTDRYSSFEIN
jgi:acylphosphatase